MGRNACRTRQTSAFFPGKHSERAQSRLSWPAEPVPPRQNGHSVSIPTDPRAPGASNRALEGPSTPRENPRGWALRIGVVYRSRHGAGGLHPGRRARAEIPDRRGARAFPRRGARPPAPHHPDLRAHACPHRISEALALRARDVDLEANEVRFRTLKRRKEHWRAVPVPEELTRELALVHGLRRAYVGLNPCEWGSPGA